MSLQLYELDTGIDDDSFPAHKYSEREFTGKK